MFKEVTSVKTETPIHWNLNVLNSVELKCVNDSILMNYNGNTGQINKT